MFPMLNNELKARRAHQKQYARIINEVVLKAKERIDQKIEEVQQERFQQLLSNFATDYATTMNNLKHPRRTVVYTLLYKVSTSLYWYPIGGLSSPDNNINVNTYSTDDEIKSECIKDAGAYLSNFIADWSSAYDISFMNLKIDLNARVFNRSELYNSIEPVKNGLGNIRLLVKDSSFLPELASEKSSEALLYDHVAFDTRKIAYSTPIAFKALMVSDRTAKSYIDRLQNGVCAYDYIHKYWPIRYTDFCNHMKKIAIENNIIHTQSDLLIIPPDDVLQAIARGDSEYLTANIIKPFPIQVNHLQDFFKSKGISYHIVDCNRILRDRWIAGINRDHHAKAAVFMVWNCHIIPIDNDRECESIYKQGTKIGDYVTSIECDTEKETLIDDQSKDMILGPKFIVVKATHLPILPIIKDWNLFWECDFESPNAKLLCGFNQDSKSYKTVFKQYFDLIKELTTKTQFYTMEQIIYIKQVHKRNVSSIHKIPHFLIIETNDLEDLYKYIAFTEKVLCGSRKSYMPHINEYGLTEFKYENVTIIAKPNYATDLETYRLLNPKDTQPDEHILVKPSSAQAQDLYREFDPHLESNLNIHLANNLEILLRSLYFTDDQKIGDSTSDIRGSYPRALYNNITPFPIFDIGDEFKPTNNASELIPQSISVHGKRQTIGIRNRSALYTVETSDHTLLKGNCDTYTGDILQYAYEEGIPFTIKAILEPSKIASPDSIKRIFDNIDNRKLTYAITKQLCCTITGYLTKLYQTEYKITLSPHQLDLDRSASEFNGETFVQTAFCTIDGHTIWKLTNIHRQRLTKTMIPIQIVMMCNQFKDMYIMRKRMLTSGISPSNIIGVNVDEITIRDFNIDDAPEYKKYVCQCKTQCFRRDNTQCIYRYKKIEGHWEDESFTNQESPIESLNANEVGNLKQSFNPVDFGGFNQVSIGPMFVPSQKLRKQTLRNGNIEIRKPINLKLCQDNIEVNLQTNLIEHKEASSNITNVISHVFTKRQSLLLTGVAGSGKSFIVRALIEEAKNRNLKSIVCAPTGIAANHINGKTIHKAFNISKDEVFRGKNVERDISHIDIIIVDEVSMCGSFLYKILQTIKLINPNVIIVLVGDFKQLPPIYSDKIYHIGTPNEAWIKHVKPSFKFIDSFILNWLTPIKLHLTICRRADMRTFDACNSLITNSEHGSKILSERFVTTATANVLCNITKAITFTNKARVEWNVRCNIMKSSEVLVKQQTLEFINGQKYKVYPGLPLIFTKTLVKGINSNISKSSKSKFVNNQMFKVIKVGRGLIEIAEDYLSNNNPKQNSHIIDNDELKHFDLAYCLTCHKAQGLTISEPYAILDWNSFSDDMKYTAVTRTSDINNVHIYRKY
jgi:DNA replication protein DnaC